MDDHLTTKEVAALLRIKERKVYDLAASGALPCSKAMGKLLFPRAGVEAWLAGGLEEGRLSARRRAVVVPRAADRVAGSHDPLLEWALRESGSGMAAWFDGSADGLARFAAGEAAFAGLHLPEAAPAPDAAGASTTAIEWNRLAVAQRPDAAAGAVLLGFARRSRGLILHERFAGATGGLARGVADLAGRRVVARQPGSGSQALAERLLAAAGVDPSAIAWVGPARDEGDAAFAIAQDDADAAFGLESAARARRLTFSPLLHERFDLLVDRRAWFEPPSQRFAAFCRSDAFRARAEALGGYDVSELFEVRFNGT